MIRLKLSLGILVFLFGSSFCQIIDTLKYYAPINIDSLNTMMFVGDCFEPDRCEPLSVWFTPNSFCPDSSLKVYSIKAIRFCFLAQFDSILFSIHLGYDFPTNSNMVYDSIFSVNANEVSDSIEYTGIAKFKEIDVSHILNIKNLSVDSNFWVLIDEKVFAIWNTHKITDNPHEGGSGHSYYKSFRTDNWKATDFDWCIEAVVEFSTETNIDETNNKNIFPKQTELFQNYPNPFNPLTTIRYALPEQAQVDLAVYDIQGRLIRNLVSGVREAGQHEAQWDGRDANGRAAASGVYLYKLSTNQGFTQTRKLLLLK